LVKFSRRHVAVGVGLAAARASLRATAAVIAPARLAPPVADTIWRSPLLTPVRPAIEREIAALAAKGRREEQDVRRRLEAARERLLIGTLERPEVERLIVRALDSPATDRIVQRVLQSPGVERAIVRVLDSELLLESTERALRSQELRRVVEWIANSREVREAVLNQSAGLADVVGREVRGRSANADDRAERLARSVLRRPRRGGDEERR
jgi:hypothetical protein